MAEEPPETSGTSEPDATPTVPTLPPSQPPRRSLPRAARLSRLQPEDGPSESPPSADTAPREATAAATPSGPPAPPPAQPAAETPPVMPAAPVGPPPDVVPINRPRDRSPVEELAAQVARSNPDEQIPGRIPPVNTREVGGRGKLTAIEGGLIKDPIVLSAPGRNPVMFKATLDKGAQRAASLSGVGLVLCMAPLLSLFGMVWGIASLRRIKRSHGNLSGEKTARFAIYVGLVGFLIGATIDMVLIIRG